MSRMSRSAYGLTLDPAEDWRPYGLCTNDPDLWSSALRQDIVRAMHICGHCPVRVECARDAEQATHDRRRGVVYAGVFYADNGLPDRRGFKTPPMLCGWCVSGR